MRILSNSDSVNDINQKVDKHRLFGEHFTIPSTKRLHLVEDGDEL